MINETAGLTEQKAFPGADGRETAFGQPAEIGPQSAFTGRKFISFFFGGASYAVDSQTVSEVVRHLTPTGLPNTPDWLLGIANLRSEIVTVIDLKKLIGKEAAPEGDLAKHVVIRLETMDALIAFRVEKLREILTIDNVEIAAPESGAHPYVSGTFTHKSESFTVLNVGKLVGSLKVV
jgi:chemotaxis signal transduction protein